MIGTRKRIIIIGGSAAGPKAAARVRRLDQTAEVVIIQKEPDLSMASCGYPYYIGGLVNDRRRLLSTGGGTLRDPAYFRNTKGIVAMVDTEVTEIDRKRKSITCSNLLTNKADTLQYDRLIIATGSLPSIPDVPGKNLTGITTVKSMYDVDFLRSVKDDGKIKKAVVIGGGSVGLELCEALQMANINVVLIEAAAQIVPFLDWQLAKIIENYLMTKIEKVITDSIVSEFRGESDQLTSVVLTNGKQIPCELCVISIGVKPNSTLARSAGLLIGPMGGITVDPYMQTSDPSIYAAGDCTEQNHLITGEATHAPFGDLANLEGRVAGENAVMGNKVSFPGTIHSRICKIFDYAVGSVGIPGPKVLEKGETGLASVLVAGTDKPGYMKGQTLISKMIIDRRSEKILGFQCIGLGDVSKQLAQASIAVQSAMNLNDIANLDLAYAPPYSAPIDNFIVCAHVLQNKLSGQLKGISAEDVLAKLKTKERSYFLDVRDLLEFENARLNVGETLIPLGLLRERLNELPQDKNGEIIVYCKNGPRSYEAALFLESQGWSNVKVLEGGISAWPYTEGLVGSVRNGQKPG